MTTLATQNELLLDLLRVRGRHGVTPMDALTGVGSFRLAARVYDLRQAGYEITSSRFRTPSGAMVARYVLEEAKALGQIGMFDGG